MGKLDNQNIIVIGGTSGIGLATAVLARAEGANVWAASRSEDKVVTCTQAYPDINFSQLDIHDVDGMNALSDAVACPAPMLADPAPGAMTP